MITINELTIEDINLILSGLSELPTKSGAYPVAMKIKAQAEAQLPSEQKTDEKVVVSGEQ